MADIQTRDVAAVTTAPPTTITLSVGGMTCATCAMRIEKGLKKVPGVTDAAVNLATEHAQVTYDPTVATVDALLTKVVATGYTASPLHPASTPRIETTPFLGMEHDLNTNQDVVPSIIIIIKRPKE